jgi:hypothetical protein
MSTETQFEGVLRAELAGRAEAVQVRPGFTDGVQRGVGRDRNRRRAAGGSVLAVAVAAVVAGVAVLSGGAGRQDAADGGMSTETWGDSLLAIPTRGSLAHDAAFMAQARDAGSKALTGELSSGSGTYVSGSLHILYAGDDGTYRIVALAGLFRGGQAPVPGMVVYDLLIGPSGTSASSLKASTMGATYPAQPAEAFVGPSPGPGQATPVLVLGPTDMTDIAYSAHPLLDANLKLYRTAVPMHAVDGAAMGEIPQTTDALSAYANAVDTMFKGRLGDGRVLRFSGGEGTGGRVLLGMNQDPKIVAAYHGFDDALLSAAATAGVTLDAKSPLVYLVHNDLGMLAAVQGASIANVQMSVAWVGKERDGTLATVLNVDVPGLPALQLFAEHLQISAGAGQESILMRIRPRSGAVPTAESAFRAAGGVNGNLAGPDEMVW